VLSESLIALVNLISGINLVCQFACLTLFDFRSKARI
jgi:hypothetical protein